jgi:cell division septation protein DedD
MRNPSPESNRTVARTTPRRIARVGLSSCLMGMVLLVFLIAGCGGDNEEAAPETGNQAMVPVQAVADSTGESSTVAPDGAATIVDDGNLTHSQGVGQTADAVTESAAAVDVRPVEAAPETKPVVETPGTGTGAYSVQLGSFQVRSFAVERSDQVKAAGFAPVIEPADVAGVTYYRVLVRGLSDRAAAEEIGEALRDRLNLTYLVKRDD